MSGDVERQALATRILIHEVSDRPLRSGQQSTAYEVVTDRSELGRFQGGAKALGQPVHEVLFVVGRHLHRMAHLGRIHGVGSRRQAWERRRQHLRCDEHPANDPAESDSEREYRGSGGVAQPRVRAHRKQRRRYGLVEHRVVQGTEQGILLGVRAQPFRVLRMGSEPGLDLCPSALGELAVYVRVQFSLGNWLHFTTFRGITV